jgi:hypothetical protein
MAEGRQVARRREAEAGDDRIRRRIGELVQSALLERCSDRE